MTSKRRWFTIRVGEEEWPSFSWYILQRTPALLQDGSEINQVSYARWFPETYMATLAKWRQSFPPELLPGIIQGLDRRRNRQDIGWEGENRLLIRSTPVACCLVSSEWNRTFTPILYEDILLDGRIRF